MQELYIGLMSGTSMDAIDAALVDFTAAKPQLLVTHKTPMPHEMREKLLALCTPGFDEINQCGMIDIELGKLFAHAANSLLEKSKITADKIKAIGSHGQTIRHRPDAETPFTLQIGNPNVIAALTGITTIADFRMRDIVNGGQGAPFAPAFHNHILRSAHEDRIVLNLGGIANITYLPADMNLPVTGFDTGPANILLDAWINKNLQKSYDQNGEWAQSGKVDEDLLKILLQDPYFKLKSPKSTGREYFNLPWLEKYLNSFAKKINAQDIQATLTELTSQSIASDVYELQHRIVGLRQKRAQPNLHEFYKAKQTQILVCGGGINNNYLMDRIKINCQPCSVRSTEDFGIHPAWMEAILFAWLAQQTLLRKPVNLTSITGAKSNSVLGGIFVG